MTLPTRHPDGVPVQACETCRFWRELDRKVGDCRRYAPRAFIRARGDETAIDMTAFWPETSNTEWCGEWEFNPHLDDEDE